MEFGDHAVRPWAARFDERSVTLLGLIVLALVIRAITWQFYAPGVAQDTSTYTDAALAFANLDFSHYLGRRTPLYPLLLAAAGMRYGHVWLIQSALGIVTSVVVFLLVLECVASHRLAFVVGAFQSLTFNQLFMEAEILSETLATFFVTVSVLLFVRAVRRSDGPAAYAVVGGVVAAATLTRPQFVFLGPLFLALVAVCGVARNRMRLVALAAAFALPLVVTASFNKVEAGFFGLSSQLGLSLAQHSGKFIDLAPDEYADLRDIYLRHRAQMPPGADHMSIWEAVPDMLAETHVSFLELNRRLTKLSLTLFAEHPGRYLRSVMGAWISFWPVHDIRLDLVRDADVARALRPLWRVEVALLRAFNLAFVIACLAFAPSALRNIFRDRRTNVYVVLASVVLGSSVLQALIEATDNARYSVPTQPLVAVFCFSLAFQLAQRFLRMRRTAA